MRSIISLQTDVDFVSSYRSPTIPSRSPKEKPRRQGCNYEIWLQSSLAVFSFISEFSFPEQVQCQFESERERHFENSFVRSTSHRNQHFVPFLYTTRWIFLGIMLMSHLSLSDYSTAPHAGSRPIYPTFTQRFALPAKSLPPPALRSSSVESTSSHGSHTTSGSGKDSVFDGRFDGDERARSVSTAATSTRGSVPPSSPIDKENPIKPLPKSRPNRKNNNSGHQSNKPKSSISRASTPKKPAPRRTTQKELADIKTVKRDALRAAFSSGVIKAETVSEAQVAAIQEKAVREAQQDGRLPRPKETKREEARRQRMAKVDRQATDRVRSALVWDGGELELHMEKLFTSVGTDCGRI